jgi:hypothetical protein
VIPEKPTTQNSAAKPAHRERDVADFPAAGARRGSRAPSSARKNILQHRPDPPVE